MSWSSFSKAYKEIANLEPMEMTFTIEDADLDKLHDVLKDINVRECPWFEVQDKHGNKAKYYREPRWIPCSERLPEVGQDILMSVGGMYTAEGCLREDGDWAQFRWNAIQRKDMVGAWMPLPEPWRGEE